jgi:hypothetical protein
MNFPSDPIVWFKLIGAITTGLGSILLAWRAKEILKWVVYCLVAHESSIEQLKNIVSNTTQTAPIILGVTKHLLDVESKLGIALFITGFALLGIGHLCSAISIFLGSA